MEMMHTWSTSRLMVANPDRLWKMAAIVTKNIFFFFFKFFKYCKEQCCYQTIKEQCIYNYLSDHEWWPRLPSNMAVAASQTWKLVKKTVKNRKLLKKIDSSHLKPFGQMNRILVGSIYGKFSVVIAHFVPIR